MDRLGVELHARCAKPFQSHQEQHGPARLGAGFHGPACVWDGMVFISGSTARAGIGVVDLRTGAVGGFRQVGGWDVRVRGEYVSPSETAVGICVVGS